LTTLENTSQFGDGGIDAFDVGRTLLQQWRKISAIALVTTGLAAGAAMLSQPGFIVSGTMYLGDAESGGGGAIADAAANTDFVDGFAINSDVQTDIDLIRSRALVEQAIEETGLNAAVTPAGGVDLRYWQWHYLNHSDIGAFAPGPADLVARFATMEESASGTVSYTLTFGGQGAYRITSGGGWLRQPGVILAGTLDKPSSGGGLNLLLQPAVAGFVPAAGAVYRITVTPAKVLADDLLTGALSVAAGGTVESPTKVANLQLACSHPYQGRDFLNQLMLDFIATQISWKTESASSTERFIASQLDHVQASLQAADDKLANFQSKTGIIDVPGEATALINQLSGYEVQRSTLLLQQQALSQLSAAMRDAPAGINPYLVSQVNDPVMAGLATSLATDEVQLHTLLAQYTGRAPEVIQQEATIADVEAAIRTLIANDTAQATHALNNIDNLIAQYNAKMKSVPADSLQVVALNRSSDVFGQLYVLLMQKAEEAAVSKAAVIANTRIVSEPELPVRAASPKAGILIAAGLLFGLLAGASMVLVQRALSGRFQNEDEIRRTMYYPVFGLIPRRPIAEAQGGILPTTPFGPFTESFRMLRSNIYRAAMQQKMQIILVTSATIGDGKTTVAVNLAKVLSDDGKRVLLVDADLHRGRVFQALNIADAPGLTEWFVTGQRPAFKAFGNSRFMVLAAGHALPSPSETLNMPCVGEIFSALREEFDHIIIESPPLPLISDSLTLGKHADFLLSVVRVRHTPRRGFHLHHEMLNLLERPHGMVINAVAGDGYGYGGMYGYGYGYGDARSRSSAWAQLRDRLLGAR
jgi:tyrosine-protein kinase Etk/Wzc